MVRFCPLASGSKGNCLFLSTPKGDLLIDAGISARALSGHLESLGSSLSSIQAILISHEHYDHISGLKTLALRHRIPIIANYATAEGIVESIGDCPDFYIFSTGEPFEFLDLKISPFTVPHDGVDPTGFTIQTEETKIGVCTDLGFVTPSIRQQLQKCHLLYLEANHQEEMVLACARPEIYKRRVLGKTGHLSNRQAAQLLCEVAHPELQKVYLAHLSSECNSPEKAKQVISKLLNESGIHIEIDIAHQHQQSTPYTCKKA